jgi:hypothetical protein
MLDHPIHIDTWLGPRPSGSTGQEEYWKRRAMVALLRAVSRNPLMGGALVLNGGLCMALQRGGPRLTSDVDLLTSADMDAIHEQVRAVFQEANGFRLVEFLALNTSPQVKVLVTQVEVSHRVHSGEERAPSVVKVDFCYLPYMKPSERLVDEAHGIRVCTNDVYGLVSTKLTGLIKQQSAQMHRAQDVYDIAWLIRHRGFTPEDKSLLRRALGRDAECHELTLSRDMLRAPYVAEMARQNVSEVRLKPGTPPMDFEADFRLVQELFEQLPW